MSETKQDIRVPAHEMDPLWTMTIPSSLSDVENWLRTALFAEMKTFFTFLNKTSGALTVLGPRGGNPSYSTAFSASVLWSGTSGDFWNEPGLCITCGEPSWGMPSTNTWDGVAPRASGWLSHTTISAQFSYHSCQLDSNSKSDAPASQPENENISL